MAREALASDQGALSLRGMTIGPDILPVARMAEAGSQHHQ